ncbi:cutinase family protein [Nocardia sp. NPDC050630]|uniref:cutinase family protein n=1 Tax=Nocardia sp. NPDC050630 TaxID=3364321 RepID=UPI0037A20B7F
MKATYRRTIIAATTLSLAFVMITHATADAQPGLTSNTGAGCPTVAGIFVPGTWETSVDADPTRPRGLLAPVAAELENQFGDKFEDRFPAYAARAMDGMSYGDSEAQGVAAAKSALSEIANRCRATKFIIAGYSQGADAAGDLASEIGCDQTPIPPQRVLAVGLIADPKQGTQGGKLVGPQVNGTGIRGTRPTGFCQLSAVTAQLCEQRDRYCATDAASNPILAGLGKALSQPTSASTAASTDTTSQGLTESLDAGFSKLDLTHLTTDIATIVDQITSGRIDTTSVGSAASSAGSVLSGLADLGRWATGNPSVQRQLSNASPGSPEQLAGQILTAVQQSDIQSAIDATTSLTQNLGASGNGHNTVDPALAQSAETLASAIKPLTSTPTDALSQAAGVLSLLKPSTLVKQITTVGSGAFTFAANIPKILDAARQIGAAFTDPNPDLGAKVRAVHQIFGTINNLCQPLVQMAAGVDLSTVSTLIELIPDPNGIASIVSLIVGLLGNLDVIGLARQVGTLQENLWHIAETITGGGDLLAIGGAFAQLVPTLLGFATIAVDTLTGSAAKTSPEMLNTPTTVTGGGTDLAGIAELLTRSASSQGADSLSQLVSEGIDAAQFYNSGAHQSYDSYVVGPGGETALEWLTKWFANRIRQVGV